MNKATMNTIIIHLRGLGNGTVSPVGPKYGICGELSQEFNVSGIRFVKKYVTSWPEYNGNPNYPVDHPTKEEEEAYTWVADLWAATPYGDARRRLCLHIANELEAELTTQEADWYINATTVVMAIVLGCAVVGIVAVLEYFKYGAIL